MGASTGPDDIDMDTFSDENTNCYAPPAHIAARFYRKTTARRKSSAHSSRRNSLSSLHSHHSALSAHGGPQSDHVAQHLRRASIIESRKARLADRAAHAERVRLRAAIAKAQPRGTYKEERAIAAHAAREKLLAEIAARCEEEVRRAKKVAEETKEKKAAEHARFREEMAEKFAEAARRRLIHQQNIRRPRTMSLPAVEEKKVSQAARKRLNQEVAAKVIQTSWRSSQRRKAVSSFLDLELSLKRVQDMEFEKVGSLLSEETVLAATNGVLKSLGLLDIAGHGAGDKGSVRIFLSTYLVLGHPLQALSNGGKEPQEQDLMAKAQDLLEAFERYLNKHKTTLKSQGLNLAEDDNMSFLFSNFCSAFHSWKTRDSSTIIEIMVNQFVELDLILQTVKNDRAGGAADEYFQAIRQNQILLLARLKKFAGPETALNLVRSAVRKARKQRNSTLQKGSNENVPRTSNMAEATSSSNSTTNLATESAKQQTSSGGVAPSSFVSRLGQTMTILPSNREISHEMQINGTYEVQQQPWTESRKHFIDTLRSNMRQSMSEGGGAAAASWTHAMAILIRDKLLNLITRRHPLYDRIDGFLDPKLIDQTCRAGMFSYPSFFETIASLIAQICSPGRDEAIKAFAADKTSDTIDRLFVLINIIDLMTLDHINFAFRTAAPAIVERGHEHEHSYFERDLKDGVHTLDSTRQWWAAARSSLQQPASSSTNHNSLNNSNGNSIYAKGLVDLVLSNTHLSYTTLPETLRLDWLRLLSLRAHAFKVVATASILLTTKIRLRRNREAQWSRDAERIMGLDFTEVDTARIVSIIESSHMMPEATREGLHNFVGRTLPSAVAATCLAVSAEQNRALSLQSGIPYDPSLSSPRSPPARRTSQTQQRPADDTFTEQVATFVLKSLREHVFARLAAVSTAEKVRTTTSASEVLARAGMPEFGSEVAMLVDRLEKIKRVDFRCHEAWFDEIAREA